MNNDKVIFYYDYASKLLKQENDICEATGKIPDELFNKVKKIFEWDLELDLIIPYQEGIIQKGKNGELFTYLKEN